MFIFKRVMFVILVLICISYAAGPAMVGADFTYRTMHIQRGMPWDPGSIMYDDAWINWGDFTAIVNFQQVLHKPSNAPKSKHNGHVKMGEFNEVDLILNYKHMYEKWGFSLEWCHCAFLTNVIPDMDFITLGLYTNFKIVNFSLVTYLDHLSEWEPKRNGLCFKPIIKASYTLGKLFTPSFEVSTNYALTGSNKFWFNVGHSYIVDVTATVGAKLVMPGDLGKYMSISGDINFATLVINRIIDDPYYKTNKFYGGIGLNFYVPMPKDK